MRGNSIHRAFALRGLKVVLALVLGLPATLVWMPYMVPFALFGPVLLVRDLLAGNVNAGDVRTIVLAIAGTAGLAGFWLWVFDHPGRSSRVQRGIGVLWLAGSIVLWAYIQAARDLSGAVLAASVAVAIAVMLTGLMMSLRPRPSQQDPESIT